ncbi:MFS transporter [Pelagibius sp. Alg239-R121]|uniref:MFS transporter n=1 Tax=Pelagibius sp. Alg239-R121 TaxID=2993448 RepID=UPI0024A774A9|nr:MFS transporter [Pelagibius sp. Alg239-R121]
MITRRTVLCLGLSQLICWGVSYYLIAVFGPLIVADLGWSEALVYGGLSAAIVTMGLASPMTGKLIDRHGGRKVMTAGSILTAVGCGALALAESLPSYFGAWLCLGFAMRLTLYDAAFAALARIGGLSAKQPIAQITLLGGLASTIFWPLGAFLAELFGWRGGMMIYAALALMTLPLHLALPRHRRNDCRHSPKVQDRAELLLSQHLTPRQRPLLAAGLYGVMMAALTVLSSGLSAHMIGLLTGLGLTASAAVWVAALRGAGQSSARLCEVLFGRRLDPLSLNLAATSLLPVSFIAGFFGSQFLVSAAALCFFYGAGNGLATITRGTLPLVLFEQRLYGAVVGWLLVPSFLLAAAAPITYAHVMTRFGSQGALYLSIVLAATALTAALILNGLFRSRARVRAA